MSGDQNDVVINVKGTNTSGPALKAAKEDTTALGTAAEKTSAKLKVEATEAGALERKLLELKATATKLGEEFKKTGDQDVLKQFNKTTAQAGGLEKFSKDFEKLGGEAGKAAKETAKVAEEAVSVGKTLVEDVGGGAEQAAKGLGSLSMSMDALPDAGKIKMAAIALAALPGIAAAGGAALAGIGLIGITAGIVGAVKQAPQISAAFDNELSKVKASWLSGSSAFIQPTLTVVKEIGAAVNGIPIEKTLKELSKYTESIGTGVASALSSIGTGVTNMIHDAAPVLKALGPDIANLGNSIGKALDSIGSGADGSAKALTQILRIAGDSIEVVGKLVGWFGQAYGAVDKFGHGVTDVVNEIAKFDPLLKPLAAWQNIWDDRQPAAFGSVLTGVSQTVEDTAKSADDAAAALKALNDQMASAVNNALGLENANVAVAAGFDDLAKAVKGHTRTLEIGSDAGRENIGVVTDMIQKLEQQREKAIEAGNGSQAATDAANAAFQSQIDTLRSALKQLGFNKAAVDALVLSLAQIPNDITTTVHIRTVGGDTMDKAKQTGRQDAHGGAIGGAASGGLRSGMVEVGEAGPEILDMSGLVGATVHTTGDSARIRAGGGGYSGPGGVGAQSITLVVKAGDNSDRTRALVADIRAYVQIQGGDGSVLGVTSV